ncbi:MAG: SDR family oxidoreductase [Xanthomonadales bacterium]|nr:SDR family oxidoreductase [Xanthomonadales bacterium]
MPDSAPDTTDPTPWALVTGASAGIGEEFCRQLAARGYHLVLVARRADRLHALAERLKTEHGTASLVLPADLSDPRAATQIVRQLGARDIEVEFLVNNAGYGLPGRFTEASWEDHQRFIQVMMTAVCELTWRLLPPMQSRKKGYVINVASVAGLMPGSEGHTLYGASKAFLISFSESLALENRFHSVHVSALCPGFTYSEFHDVTGTREMANRLPSYWWLDADDVVRFGIDSVLRDPPRVVAVTGWFYRVMVAVHRYFPWISRITMRRMSRKFRKMEQR